MLYDRKILRNALKKKQGNNHIREIWRRMQIKKYGVNRWCFLYNESQNKGKENRITPKTAFEI